MRKPSSTIALLLTAVMGVAGAASAQDHMKTQDRDPLKTQDMDKDQDQDRLRDQDQLYIYGYELMTDQERIALRERMRATKTLQERDRIRTEHRIQMDARAKERGVTIMHRDGSPSNAGAGGSTGAGAGAGSKK